MEVFLSLYVAFLVVIFIASIIVYTSAYDRRERVISARVMLLSFVWPVAVVVFVVWIVVRNIGTVFRTAFSKE